MSHDDFAFEPVRGLPEELPAGERILWQGAPSWVAMARHVFHVRFVAAYFAVIATWRVISAANAGALDAGVIVQVVWALGLGALAIAVLGVIAYGYGRTTVYTVTNRRVVIRSGVAFQITFNLPFAAVMGAGLRHHRDGTGDIPLTLDGAEQIAYLHIWPNVRPWKLTRPEPMLRNIPAPDQVAELLTDALKVYHAENGNAGRAAQPTAIRASDRPRVVRRPPAVVAAE